MPKRFPDILETIKETIFFTYDSVADIIVKRIHPAENISATKNPYIDKTTRKIGQLQSRVVALEAQIQIANAATLEERAKKEQSEQRQAAIAEEYRKEQLLWREKEAGYQQQVAKSREEAVEAARMAKSRILPLKRQLDRLTQPGLLGIISAIEKGDYEVLEKLGLKRRFLRTFASQGYQIRELERENTALKIQALAYGAEIAESLTRFGLDRKPYAIYSDGKLLETSMQFTREVIEPEEVVAARITEYLTHPERYPGGIISIGETPTRLYVPPKEKGLKTPPYAIAYVPGSRETETAIENLLKFARESLPKLLGKRIRADTTGPSPDSPR